MEALDARTGALRWSFATRGASHKFSDKNNDTTSVLASPAIGGGIVAVGGRDGYLYAIDVATGRLRWNSTEDGSSWILSTAIEGGTVYVGGGSASIVQALDIATGKEKWRFATHGAVFSSISVAAGTLYFSDFGGFAYAVDSATGRLHWRFPLGDRGFATPVPADGIVYAAADNGILAALEGGPAVSSSAPEVRRAVYWQGRKSPEDFAWFENGTDVAILNFFKAAGYEQVDAAQLDRLLQDQVEKGGRSVIVFADSRIPESLAEQAPEASLIRRYLDRGGKAVFLGIDPLSLHFDPKSGLIDRVDDAHAGAVLGIAFPPRQLGSGYYASRPTPEGVRWGLRDAFVGTGIVDPHQPVTMLARDEFGMASAWAKNYGGPEGTGLLQLNLPRFAPADYAPILAAAEHGLQ